MVILVEPRLLDEVISVTDAMRPNCRSRGVATEEAMVSGLAPGNDAETDTVGKSTCGSGDTGSIRNATEPANAMATVSKVVATGRLMKTSEIFIIFRRNRLTSVPPRIISHLKRSGLNRVLHSGLGEWDDGEWRPAEGSGR
jgi:hypothetical protein